MTEWGGEPREWKPGDDPILPDADPSGYLPESTPLPAVNKNMCWMCGNFRDFSSDSGLCEPCLTDMAT